MANRRFIDFPIAASVGDNDIVLIWQDGLNKQTTKSTLFAGSPSTLASLTDVDISALTNGQILQYNSTTSKWENVDRTDIDLNQLGDVTIVSPTNGQVLVYNSSTSKWENSSGGFVPYTGAVTTVNLGAQSILAGTFVKAGGTSAQFLKADGSVDSNTYLTTGSAAATYVPYTGATADVNLGTHDLTAERGTFANNGSSDTLTVNHTSGSGYGIKVTKGGNNEALLVTKTSGSGNAMAVVGGRTALVDLSLSSVSNATGNFLTISGGVVHQRTPSETRSDVGAQAQLNGTGFVKASGTTISYDNSTYQVTSEKGQPNGYASLDGNGKVPLAQINDALIGNVNYQGLWNASTNTPTLANPPSSGTKGYYYIVSTAGTFASIIFEVGDWIISNGSAWQKVDNTDAVSSVFGRTGNVIAANGDYNTSQVTENTNLYYTEARVSANTDVAANTAARHNAVTLGTANGLSLSTQQLSLQLATSGQNGALSSTDWTTFNNKENAITAGTTAQYFRGDKTFQTLNTSVVPELTNLYYTEARVSANTDVAANTAARHNAVTLGTANGLSLSTQQLSLGLASAGVTGALSGTDWSAFNSKQQALNGTGFVKISGTTISYDNSTYLTTAAAASTYLALAGGTMTGNVNWGQTDRGITWAFNTDAAYIKFFNTGDGDTDSRLEFATQDNNDEYFRWGHVPSGGSFYESMRLRPIGSGSAELIVTGKIIKSGGTSSQFLKADGSVDSNSYYLSSNPSAFIALTALSGTAPIQYNNTTGAISITQASGSTNGFLSSTDWNTFNNKTSNVGTVTSVAALTLGTSGTDLSSTVANSTTTPVITLNVPTASATNRGALSAADWTTFNNKQNALTNPVTGTGTANTIPKFTGTSTIGNSLLTDNGTTLAYGNNIISVGASNTSEKYLEFGSSNGAYYVGGTSSEHYIFGQGDKPLRLYTNGTLKATLTSSGNLGLGVTPSAWFSTVKAIDISTATALWAGGNGQPALGYNVFVNTSGNLIYKTSEFASRYEQISGQHQWYTAPSGTSGNAISFTQAMTLTSGGNLILTTGAVSDNGARLQVSGRSTVTDSVGGNTIMEVSNTNTTNGFGLFVRGGVGSTSYAFNVVNAANTVDLFKVMGSGAATFSSSVTANGDITSTALEGKVRITSTAGSGKTYQFISIDTGNLGLFDGTAYRLWVAGSGNVGIGTTSPSAMLTLLGLTPFIRIERSGVNTWQIQNNNNVGTITGFSINNVTAGTIPFFINQDTGNLLLGATADNGFRLDVNGTGRFSSLLTINSDSGGSAIRLIGRAAADASAIRFFANNNSTQNARIESSSNAFEINSISNIPITFYTNDTLRLTIANSTGAATFSSSVTAGGDIVRTSSNVGGMNEIAVINTATSGASSSRLRISTAFNGGTTLGDALTQYTDNNNFNWATGSGVTTSRDYVITNHFTLGTNERLRITASGNVGIGSNNPDEILRINGYSNGSSRLRLFNQGTELGALGSYSGYIGSGNANDLLLITPNNLAFAAGSTERMRITSGGELQLKQSSNSAQNSVIFNTTIQNAMTLNSSGFLILNGTTGSSRITCYGDGYFSGGIQTGNPYGSTSANWLLGRFLTETTSANGSIRVQIGSKYYNIAAEDLGTVPT